MSFKSGQWDFMKNSAHEWLRNLLVKETVLVGTTTEKPQWNTCRIEINTIPTLHSVLFEEKHSLCIHLASTGNTRLLCLETEYDQGQSIQTIHFCSEKFILLIPMFK